MERCCCTYLYIVDERGTLTIDHLHELVEKSKLGKVIDYAEKAAEDNELAERYLHDYVHMVYKPRGKRDFNVCVNKSRSLSLKN